jgi:hypothetical protein
VAYWTVAQLQPSRTALALHLLAQQNFYRLRAEDS